MITVYWRRKYEFPAECIGAVQVVRGEHWGGEPLDHDESHDTGWHRIDVDLGGGAEVVTDVWGPLGLCGDLTSPALIADAVCVAAAIVAELGVRPPMPDDMVYDCPWRPSDLDGGGTDDNPSDAYTALQVHCASVYEELREKLAERHGIDLAPLAAN